MQKVIFVLISIIILSLIGCGGLVGQGTGNEKSTNTDQIQSDLVEALEKVVELTEESEQLRSEIDTLNQQADNIRADIEEDWQKRNEELEKNYTEKIQFEVSKPEPTKSLFVLEGLKLFDQIFFVFESVVIIALENFSPPISEGSKLLISFSINPTGISTPITPVLETKKGAFD